MLKKALGFLLAFVLLLTSAASAEFLTLDLSADDDMSVSIGTPQDDPGASLGLQENAILSAAIVSSGHFIWRFSGEDLVCSDASTGNDISRIPFLSLYAEDPGLTVLQENGFNPDQASVLWLKLISRDETGISFCLVLEDSDGSAHVLMYDLAFSDGEIHITGVRDVTKILGQFFDPDLNWLEVNMFRMDNGTLVIGALDSGLKYHLYTSRPAKESPAEIGTESLMSFISAIPHNDTILLACTSMDDLNALELSFLNPETGERSDPEIVTAGTEVTAAMNFAWSKEKNLLCFCVNNTAYRVSPGTGEPPVPMQVFDKTPAVSRLSSIVGDQYFVYAEDGSLLSCSLQAEIKSARIRILDASGDENLPDLISGFNSCQTDYHVLLSSCDDETTILEKLLNQSNDYDIYLISTDSGIYSALKNKGYFVDLSHDDIIRNAVADMPESIRTLVSEDGRVTGLPICTQNSTLSLNVKALQELTGCSREEIPTDWPGMLRLLNQMAEDGIMEQNPQYSVYESALTVSLLKESLFALIMSDCLLWQNQCNAAPDEIPAVLLPALQELEAIAWDQFGLTDEMSMDIDWMLSNEKIPLLQDVQGEIAVMDLDDGVEYWPLSLNSECPRLIPEAVSVMVINPWSTQTQGAQTLAEYIWENLDTLSKMSLSLSLNEPVLNTAYDEDIDFLEQLLASFRERIDTAKTEKEAEALRNEMAETEKYLNDYRENAGWIASESSIAEYRALSSQFAPAVPEFWSADEEDAAVLQFLDGMMPAEQFVAQFVSSLKMALLEGE